MRDLLRWLVGRVGGMSRVRRVAHPRFVLHLPLVVAVVSLGGPARSLIVDDFSTGAFTVQGGVAGATATQACGSFCLNGSREVFIQSGNAVIDAFVALAPANGEATNVMPDGGGLLRFTYMAPGTTTVDLTVGSAGSVLEVWFNAFEPGADVQLTVFDDSAASDTLSQTPVLPAPPARVSFALSDLTGVDLQHVVSVEVSVVAPAAGDYHVFLILVPIPDQIPSDFSVIGGSSISGPPYPTESITLQACDPDAASGGCTPTLNVELSLVDVPNAGDSLPAMVVANAVPSAESGFVSIGSEVMGVEPEPFREEFRLAYQPPDPGHPPPDDTMPVLDWRPGEDHFEVTVDVMVEGGVQRLVLFGEPDPGQSISIMDVSATQGASTLISVQLSAPGSDPTFHMTLGGQFTPIAGVPTLGPFPFAILAATLMVIGAALLREKGPTA